MTRNSNFHDFALAFAKGAAFAFTTGITIGAILFIGMVL